MLYFNGAYWTNYRRTTDFYPEGELLWLGVDTKIRQLSHNRRSLDDFARLFYSMDNGSYVTRTYTFNDLVAALNAVQPYDWADFLRARVYKLASHTPEDGITRGGYRLAFTDTPPAWLKDSEGPGSSTSFATSLGFTVNAAGDLGNVWWDSPAFKAGMTPDTRIAAVNGKAFSLHALRDAIIDAEKTTAPLKFLVQRGKQFQTIEINYHGGLRYPRLLRVEGTPDRLDHILAPK